MTPSALIAVLLSKKEVKQQLVWQHTTNQGLFVSSYHNLNIASKLVQLSEYL